MAGKDETMDYSAWFQQHLQTSADGFAWAVGQVAEARHYASPPRALGDWHVARHLFHMLDYEREIAVPVMRQWLGAPPAVVNWDEEANWEAHSATPIPRLLEEFQAVRRQQLAMLPQLAAQTWHTQQMTGWGPVPLLWVVTKTFQHTNEHTHDVLRLALFWDYYAGLEAAAGGEA